MILETLLLGNILLFQSGISRPLSNQNTSMVYDNDAFCRYQHAFTISGIDDDTTFTFYYQANPNMPIFNLNIEKGSDSLIFFISNENLDRYNLTCDLLLDINGDSLNGIHKVLDFSYMNYDYGVSIGQRYFDFPTDILNIQADFTLMSEEQFNYINNLYTNGYNNGLDAGYQQGYSAGESSGYQQGYSAGLGEASSQTSTALTIFSGIVEVGLLPVNVFLQFFNFEVFGINISALVMSIMTIAITIIVIRMVTGKKDD